MSDIYKSIYERAIKEVLFERQIKAKIESGEELSTEEKEGFYQLVYSSSLEKLNGFKQNQSLKASVGITVLPAITLLGGEQTKGMYDASKGIKSGVKDTKNNFRLVMQGITKVSSCETTNNFVTLLAQFQEAENHFVLLGDLYKAIAERITSYKRDLATPIAPETQEQLMASRKKVLTLNDQYETNRMVK